MDRLNYKARAKINLGLDVCRRLENGYHEVKMIMQTVDIYDELESTNQTAKKEAMIGKAGHGAFVIARSQTAGRGRRGREFYSPADAGLYISVILKPQGTLQDSLLITTAAAVAVYRAVAQICGIQLDIKWVNDLFYKGKKEILRSLPMVLTVP